MLIYFVSSRSFTGHYLAFINDCIEFLTMRRAPYSNSSCYYLTTNLSYSCGYYPAVHNVFIKGLF